MNDDIVVAAVERIDKVGLVEAGKLFTPEHLESERGFDLNKIRKGFAFADAELGFAIYRRGDEAAITSQGLVVDKDSVGPNRPLSIQLHQASSPARDEPIRTGNERSVWVLRDLCGWSRFDGKGQAVAVVDTGISLDLREQLPRQADHRDFYSSLGPDRAANDPIGHGTMMAGVIGARVAPNAQRRSVAPACEIFAAQTLHLPEQEVTIAHLLILLSWVTHCTPARAINMSLSIREYAWPGEIDLLSRAALRLRAFKGALIFCATSQPASDAALFYPARADGFVAVGTYDPEILADCIQGAKPWLQKPDLFFAPGYDLFSIDTNGLELNQLSGASCACAFATGVCALYFQAFPGKNAEAILERMRNAALMIDDTIGNGKQWRALRFPDDSVDGTQPRSGL